MIRIKDGYMLRHVLDVDLVIGIGSEAYEPNCIMSLNETGAFLWNCMETGAEESELVQKMTDEFEVTEETAAKDVAVFLNQLRQKKLLVEC